MQRAASYVTFSNLEAGRHVEEGIYLVMYEGQIKCNFCHGQMDLSCREMYEAALISCLFSERIVPLQNFFSLMKQNVLKL